MQRMPCPLLLTSSDLERTAGPRRHGPPLLKRPDQVSQTMTSSQRDFRLAENIMPRRRHIGHFIVALSFFAACFCYALRSGVIRTGPSRWLDTQFFYVSGLCWRNGESPYDWTVFEARWQAELHTRPRGPFVYPPTIGLLTIPLSLFPWEAAKWAFDTVNICALAASLWFLSRLLTILAGTSWRGSWPWLALGAGCLLSGVPAALFLGQTTILALAGTLGAICYWQRGHMLLSAACIVVAAFKPQLCALPLLYMLVTRGHRQVLLGFALTALAGALVVSLAPSAHLVDDARRSVNRHLLMPYNRAAGFSGLSSLFAGSRLDLAPLGWATVGAAFVIGVGLLERRRSAGGAVGALLEGENRSSRAGTITIYGFCLPFAATGVFMPLHLYDYALYVAIIAALAAFKPRRLVLWYLPGLALTARPGNAQALVGLATGSSGAEPAAVLASIGAVYILLLGVALWYLKAPRRRSLRKTALQHVAGETRRKANLEVRTT